jgi:hypothetical protein
MSDNRQMSVASHMSDNRQMSVAMQRLVDCRSCGKLPHITEFFLCCLLPSDAYSSDYLKTCVIILSHVC